MSAPSDDERANVADLIAAHKRYLFQIKKQVAQQGINAPPHLATEIERVEKELAQLEPAAAVTTGPLAALDDVGRFQLLLGQVNTLADQVLHVRERVAEDTAQLLRGYREDVHRSIMGLHVRMVSLEDTIETDRALRIQRQQQLDTTLGAIQANQRLWYRAIALVALVAVGIGIGIWLF